MSTEFGSKLVNLRLYPNFLTVKAIQRDGIEGLSKNVHYVCKCPNALKLCIIGKSFGRLVINHKKLLTLKFICFVFALLCITQFFLTHTKISIKVLVYLFMGNLRLTFALNFTIRAR